MRICSVANLKGGAGKTTSVVALADAVSADTDVFVIDLDPQGTLSAWLAGRSEAATALLTGDFRPADHVVRVADGIDVIPSDRSLERVVKKRPSQLSARLERLWGALSGYGLVLVDTPPQASSLVTAALLASDDVMCPVSPGRGAVDGLLHLMDYTNRIGGADLWAAFVCNVDLRSKLHKQLPSEMIDRLGLYDDGGKAAAHFVRSTVQMQEAEVASELPSRYCPSATAWEDYQALAFELFDVDVDAEGSRAI